MKNPLFQQVSHFEDKCPNPECRRWTWHGIPHDGCPGSHLFNKDGERIDAE